MKYTVWEAGRKLDIKPKTKADWERLVKGLNLSMETVDAPYQKIIVKNSKGKIVYKQEGGYG
jgi:hypothetical protein